MQKFSSFTVSEKKTKTGFFEKENLINDFTSTQSKRQRSQYCCMKIKEVKNSVVDGLFKIDRFHNRTKLFIFLPNNLKIGVWNVHSLRLSTEFSKSANL